MNEVAERLVSIARDWDLLRHPFYIRWTEGTLTQAELQDYAGQYAHVVAALPTWLDEASRHDLAHSRSLASHAEEERRHLAPWLEFAAAVGADLSAETLPAPNAATQQLLDDAARFSREGYGVGAAWAIESQAPLVSAEKLRGLSTHYGISSENGGRYFAIHERMDVEHGAELQAVVVASEGEASEGLVTAAEATAAGLWKLLTSVEAPISA